MVIGCKKEWINHNHQTKIGFKNISINFKSYNNQIDNHKKRSRSTLAENYFNIKT